MELVEDELFDSPRMRELLSITDEILGDRHKKQ
jgi:hypothetical protein